MTRTELRNLADKIAQAMDLESQHGTRPTALEVMELAAVTVRDALDEHESAEQRRPTEEESPVPNAATGSTAPAPGTMHANAMAGLLRNHGYQAESDCIYALAAERDRLARSVESYKWDAQRHAHAEDALERRIEVVEAEGREWEARARLASSLYAKAARRIEEMAQREPSNDDIHSMAKLIREEGYPYPVTHLWRYVRDALLAPPESEPRPASDLAPEPRCGLATASEGPTCDHAPLYSDGETYHCPRCDKDFTEREPCMGPAPQPQPAPPSADDVASWRKWLSTPGGSIDIAYQLAAEVSRREAALRANREYWRVSCQEAQRHRDGANLQNEILLQELAAARAQLAAATDPDLRAAIDAARTPEAGDEG